MLLIKNGLINDAVNPVPYKGDILVDEGKIVKVAAEIAAEEGVEVIDAEGLSVYPGLSMHTAT